jgi:hypothetical protein
MSRLSDRLRAKCQKNRSRKLLIEGLEDRRVMATDYALSIVGGATSITEGTGGTSEFRVNIHRSGDLAAKSVQVNFTGTAGAGDYSVKRADDNSNVGLSGNVNFTTGETDVELIVSLTTDSTAENNESIKFDLQNLTGGDQQLGAGPLMEVVDDDSNLQTDLAGNLIFTINGAATIKAGAANALTLTSNTAFSTALTGVLSNGNKTIDLLATDFTGNILVAGGANDDTLTIDIGTALPTKTISFDGKGQAAEDKLTFSGNAALNLIDYDATAAGAGTLTLNGSATVNFTGLEPVVFLSTITVANVDVSILVAGSTGTISDVGGQTKIDFTAPALEDITFSNPTTSLKITGGAGADAITIASLPAQYPGSIQIDLGGQPGDVINLNTDISTKGKAVTFNAPVVVGAPVSIDTTATVAAGAPITFGSTLNSDATARDLTLTAGQNDITFTGPVGAASRLNDLTIVSADDVTFTSTVQTAGKLEQQAGTGKTTFHGTSATGIGGALTVKTREVEFVGAALKTVGDILIQANDAVTISELIDAGAGKIIIEANRDDAGADSLVMNNNGRLVTTNNSAAAISLAVNTAAAGTGNANLRSVEAATGAGVITINTHKGAITDNNAAATNLTAFGVVVTAASAVGTTALPIDTNIAQLQATADNGGVLINETDALTINNPVTSTPAGKVNIKTGTSLTLNANVSAGTGSVRFKVGTTVTQDAAAVITASELGILAGGAVTLDTTAHAVDEVAVETNGEIRFQAAAALSIGEVTADGQFDQDATGLVSGGNNILVRSVGGLTINKPLNAGAGTARLRGTFVDQTNVGTDGLITANTLGVLATAAVTLAKQNNNVDNVAIETTNAIGFQADGDLTLVEVAADGLFNQAATGLDGTDILLGAGGKLDINKPIKATTAARIKAGGAVDQTSTGADGLVTAPTFGILAGGAVTLDKQLNDLGTIAVETSGQIRVQDKDALTIGEVTLLGLFDQNATGLHSGGNNILVRTVNGLTINQLITATGATVRLKGTTIDQTNVAGDGVITASSLGILATGAVTLAKQTNDVGTLAVESSNLIQFQEKDALTIGEVTLDGLFDQDATGLVAATGEIVVTIPDSGAILNQNLTVTKNISAANGNIRLRAGDDMTIDTGIDVRAVGGYLLLQADYGNADATGARISILGATGILAGEPIAAGEAGIAIYGNADRDIVLVSPSRIGHKAGATQVRAAIDLGAGDDYLQLQYASNFDSHDIDTQLRVIGGTGYNVVDADMYLDTLARKRQFTFLNEDGSNSTFVSKVALDAAGNFEIANSNNNTAENFLVQLEGIGGYLVRGSGQAKDQTVIFGRNAAANFITVGNIDKGATASAEDDTPALFNDYTDTGAQGQAITPRRVVSAGLKDKIGVSGAGLLRVVGSTVVDDIRVDVEPQLPLPANLLPSGANLVLIEGRGGQNVAPNTAETLQGSHVIRNVILGVGDPTNKNLTGLAPALTPAAGEAPRRVLVSGGLSNNSGFGDFLGADRAMTVNANGTFNIVKPGGLVTNVDVLYGGAAYTVTFATNMAQNSQLPIITCGVGTLFFIGGQIDVCAWLRAQFPTQSLINSGVFDGNAVLQGFSGDMRRISGPALSAINVPIPPAAFTNTTNPLDVNADGSVTPLDALYVINYLNSSASGEAGKGGGNLYIDVNGDDHITPLDALLVINGLNARSSSSGEAPLPPAIDDALATDDFTDEDLVNLLAWDALNEKKK